MVKTVLKICDLKNNKDVVRVKNAITSNEGIIACKIDKESKNVEIIYDDYFVNDDKIAESIEKLGYTII